MTVRSNVGVTKSRIRAAVTRGMVRATEAVHTEATSLILETPKTGRVYRRRGVEHQASAPGEPPASDTGRLLQSGRAEVRNEQSAVIGTVSWSTAYAEGLEYGTEHVEPRPFARPALASSKGEVTRAIISELIGVFGRK